MQATTRIKMRKMNPVIKFDVLDKELYVVKFDIFLDIFYS